MQIAFDPAKDAANIAKHGVSLARASQMSIRTVIQDQRNDYGEERFNAFGLIDGVTYCLTFTYRPDHIRVISLRRARLKEYRRHVP